MPINKTCLIRLLLLIRRFYFSGMWLGVAPTTDTQKNYHVFRRDGIACSKNMLTILGSIDIVIGV